MPVWVYLGGQRTLARMPPRTDTKNPHIPIPLPEDSIMDRVFRGVTPKVSALKWVNLQSGMSHVAFRRTASEIVYSAALIFCLLGCVFFASALLLTQLLLGLAASLVK